MSYTRGRHVIKFGVEIRRGIFVNQTGMAAATVRKSAALSPTGSVPAFSGANVLEDYLTGTSGNSTIYTGSATGTVQNIYANYYAGFIMDTMRLTRTVSVELGLRYEFQPAYAQQNNLLGTFNYGQLSGLGQEQSGKALYGPDDWHHNFGPRASLAWDINGNGKTVVRLNGGIYYGMTTFLAWSERNAKHPERGDLHLAGRSLGRCVRTLLQWGNERTNYSRNRFFHRPMHFRQQPGSEWDNTGHRSPRVHRFCITCAIRR